MKAPVHQTPGRLKVVLEQDLTAAYADDVARALADTITDETTRITLDLNKVDHIFGPGLGLLYALHTRLGAQPSRLVLMGVCPSLLNLFTRLGLDRQFALTFRPATVGSP